MSNSRSQKTYTVIMPFWLYLARVFQSWVRGHLLVSWLHLFMKSISHDNSIRLMNEIPGYSLAHSYTNMLTFLYLTFVVFQNHSLELLQGAPVSFPLFSRVTEISTPRFTGLL